jgi:hypothetical protein
MVKGIKYTQRVMNKLVDKQATITAAAASTARQENSLTLVLRTLIKQKEDTAQRYKTENLQLQQLLMKQQDLLNTLNEDNMKLSKNYGELRSSYSKMQKQQQQQQLSSETTTLDEYMTTSGGSASQDFDQNSQLIEQNASLKEQLLVSQNYGAHMLKELKEAKKRMKGMSKIVRSYEAVVNSSARDTSCYCNKMNSET